MGLPGHSCLESYVWPQRAEQHHCSVVHVGLDGTRQLHDCLYWPHCIKGILGWRPMDGRLEAWLQVNENGRSATDTLIWRCLDVCKSLIGAGIDIRARNAEGFTALHVAGLGGNAPFAEAAVQAVEATKECSLWSAMKAVVAEASSVRSFLRRIRMFWQRSSACKMNCKEVIMLNMIGMCMQRRYPLKSRPFEPQHASFHGSSCQRCML